MANDPREIRRKLRVLEHAEAAGDVSRTCRYFGIGRASFYRWRQAYQAKGEAGLASKRSVPHNHPNKTPTEVAEKVLHLRREHHLGPMRIVWYLARHHGLRISDAGVYRILKRNGLNRLSTGVGTGPPIGFRKGPLVWSGIGGGSGAAARSGGAKPSRFGGAAGLRLGS